MGFFDKVKQFLGIGTVKVELQIPPQISKETKEVEGKVLITGKSDQKIKEVKLTIVETYSTGHGSDKTSKDYELGTVTVGQGLEVKKDETKTLDFKLPFHFVPSRNQALAQEKGALGALGKIGTFTKGEKSDFRIKADLSLEGAFLTPSDSKPIKVG